MRLRFQETLDASFSLFKSYQIQIHQEIQRTFYIFAAKAFIRCWWMVLRCPFLQYPNNSRMVG